MRIAGVLALILLVACGQAGDQQADDPAVGASPGGTEPTTGDDAIEGTLGGDAQLEGGCAWIEAAGTRWDVQYPEGYDISFDPVTLTDPGGDTATEGDVIRVTGSPAQDVVTTCQVGPVWVATSVTFE